MGELPSIFVSIIAIFMQFCMPDVSPLVFPRNRNLPAIVSGARTTKGQLPKYLFRYLAVNHDLVKKYVFAVL